MITYTDDSYYKGNWSNNLPHGQGKEVVKGYSEYDGDFLYGMKHGFGKLSWQNNASYVG